MLNEGKLRKYLWRGVTGKVPGMGLRTVLGVVLLLAALACGNDITIPALPEVAVQGEATSTPAPVPAPTSVTGPAATPTPVPALSSTPTSTPASTRSVTPNPTASSDVVVSVPRLRIAPVPDNLPEYSRSGWKHWSDADGDCQNTRAEVLIAESVAAVAFRSERGCVVDAGRWEDPFTGKTFTEASDLDVDHLVPLANAHRSGGWDWNTDRKERFANSMAYENHLIAVSKSANRSKGAKGPEAWQPPNGNHHCQYAQDWIAVKYEWGLSATADEWAALEAMLGQCSYPVVFTADGADGAPLVTGPTPSAQTPTSTPEADGEPASARLVISEIMADPEAVKDADGEWFEVYNPAADRAVDLNGWTIRDQGQDSHLIDNGGPLPVPPGGYLVLGRNPDATSNGGVSVDYSYNKDFLLANSEDEIELISPSGDLVDVVAYDDSLVFTGASAAVGSGSLTVAANDTPANWCAATTELPGGDKGTPGKENDPC